MGALNITTRNSSAENEASFELGDSNFHAVEIGAMASRPVGDTMGGRIAIKYMDRDGE